MKNINRKNNTQKPEIPGKVKKGFRFYAAAILSLALVMGMSVTAFAAGDPITVVNNLSDFIFGLIRAVGLILLGWGTGYMKSLMRLSLKLVAIHYGQSLMIQQHLFF